MKRYKQLLASSIQVVVFLFGSFGGFFKKVAPPSQVGAAYPLGILSFLVLILLLIISAIARRRSSAVSHTRWLIAAVALLLCSVTAGFVYPYMLQKYTYPEGSDPMSRNIKASAEFLTPAARRYREANPSDSTQQLVQSFPDSDAVWEGQGMRIAAQQLLASYIFLVLSLSGSIFCLLEVNLGSARSR